MITKKQVLEFWKDEIEKSNWLWKCQAQINYNVIKKHTPKKALEILKKDYEKHKEMGISSFIKRAINQLEEILKESKKK